MLQLIALAPARAARDRPRQRCHGFVWRALSGVAAGLACSVAQACIELPTPPTTGDLSELEPRYDRPTGRLPEEQTSELLEQARPYLDVASRLDGLSLIRTAVSDTSKGLDDALGTDGLTVQGTIRAQLSCPGHGAIATDDSDANGALDITMGIADTRIQRALDGSAIDCEFVSGRGGQTDRITFSADFVADLGADIALGDDPAELLTVQLTDLEIRSSSTGLSLPELQEVYDFRVTGDESIEVLLDLDTLGLRNAGTVVVISHVDGSIGLREERGEWLCPPNDSCSLDRAR
jgi:hypothetical protein